NKPRATRTKAARRSQAPVSGVTGTPPGPRSRRAPAPPRRRTGPAKQRWTRASRKRLDDLNELLGPVALLASEFNKLLRAGNNGAAFSRSGDGDPATAAELEQPFLAQ